MSRERLAGGSGGVEIQRAPDLTMQCKCGSIALQGAGGNEGGNGMPGQLTVRLTSELEEGIEALSRRPRRRRSEIVRLALARFIREETGEGKPPPHGGGGETTTEG